MRAPLLGTLFVALVACGPRAVRSPPASAPGHELTLYRDRAAIKQLVELDVRRAGTTAIPILVAAGVDVDDVLVLDRGALTRATLRGPSARVRGAGDPGAAAGDGPRGRPGAPVAPSELTLELTAPRAGRYRVHLGYATDRLTWAAAYTMTTSPARDRATVRGALAIRNTTGVAFARARVFVVDAGSRAASDQRAAQLASELAAAPPGAPPGTPSHALGAVDVGPGETRVALLRGEPARAMRSVLVYDPVGAALDHAGEAPLRDEALGIAPEAPTRVSESVEIARPAALPAGPPAGPTRLLERRADGSLALLGEGRLFEGDTRAAAADTIALGTARGVTGRRARRELTIDDHRKRLVEEFVLTVTNTRPHPVEVVLREHLYRGQNWTLAYHSGARPTKDGPQQISLRTTVPAAGQSKVLYVVVYTWP